MALIDKRLARIGFVVLAVASAAILVVSTTRAQQQTKAQQACIVGVNKATRGVAKAQALNNGFCLSSASQAINPATITSCINSDLRGVLAKARGKLNGTIASKCASPPDFGFTDADTAADTAIAQEIALLKDIYGEDLPAAVISKSADSAGAKCQLIVHKLYEKVVQAELRAFESCKKNGLKTGLVSSQATLALCLDDITADINGKIAKALLKLSSSLPKVCPGVNLDAAFPGACAGVPFADCVHVTSACRACLLLDTADDTGAYCDTADNGVADGSCIDPRRCGNGTAEAGEECDDGNNADGDCCSATCESEPSGQACSSDANVCTNDVCDGSGACSHSANSHACDDGLFCNGADTCGTSTCSVHASDPCTGGPECDNACNDDDNDCFNPAGTACTDDGNVCTDDACNGAGVCAHPSNTAACDDGVFCNGVDTCAASACAHAGNPCVGGGECADSCNESGENCFDAAGTPCTDDGNVCTDDECDGSGACVHPANTVACDDNLFCNGTDTCAGGTCIHAGDPCSSGSECADNCNEGLDSCSEPANTPCTDDGNVCTDDGCDGSGACTHANNNVPCDDGLFCNGADTCASASCSQHEADPCSAGPVCNNACNDGNSSCMNPEGSPCTDDGNPCTDDICDGSGACTHSNNAASCDDGLFCNGADTCNGGTCSIHAGDPCTGGGECADACNEAADNCFDPSGTTCTDDGNECTTDECNGAGSCAPVSVPNNTACTSDGNDCTNDVCTAGSCSHPANSAPCDDGLFCNGADTCGGGSCSVHGSNPCSGGAVCQNVCNETADDCNASSGSACTSDGNVCTNDVCDGSGTCTHPSNTAPCDDGLFCNGTDTCAGGSCSAHAGDPCTGGADCADTCNESDDNCFDVQGTACNDDGNSCTINTCSGTGTCGSNNATAGTPCASDSNVCTDDVCDASGTCLHQNNTLPCDDGLFCNGSDTCSGGTCGHTGNPCTGPDGDGNCSESCNEAADNCTAADPNGSACTDGLFCNGVDTCSGGTCSSHVGDPCLPLNTTDSNCAGSCNETSDNCTASDPNGTVCNDGLFCNGADTCSSGACTAHAGSPCPGPDGDSNCSESCNEASDNCTAADTNGSACNDGLFCNGADTCSSGACTGHVGDPCLPLTTTDSNCAASCNETSDNCSATDPNGTGCNDGLFCNGADTCASGACTGHAGNPCPGPDGDSNCAESCDEASDNCTASDPNGAACNDGAFCNGSDTCSSGACSSHAGDPCLPLNTADGNCSASCNETSDNCSAADPNGTGCNDGQGCNGSDSCSGGSCAGSGTCCGTVDFTFTVNSSSGGAFSSAQWPGGTQTQTPTSGCSLTINNPNNNIDQVCTIAAPFSVNSFSGFQNCVGQGGEDGDGCEPVSCPFAGIGSCCSTRPSCSVATNGSGSARYHVHCTDP